MTFVELFIILPLPSHLKSSLFPQISTALALPPGIFNPHQGERYRLRKSPGLDRHEAINYR